MKKMISANVARRLMAILMILTMLISTFLISSVDTEAGGKGTAAAGYTVIQPFLTEKTLDLTDSEIDIRLTKAEEDQCFSQAKEWTINWLRNIILFTDEAAQTTKEYSDFHKFRTNSLGYDEIYDGNFTDMYWFKEVVIPENAASQETRELLGRIKSKSNYAELIGDSALMCDIAPLIFSGLETDKDKIAKEIIATLNGKVNEIAQDLISDKLTAQMEEKLKGYSFDFQAEEIAQKDYAKYGIDGSDIKAGKLESPVTIHTADFGAEGQFYDEIMAKGAEDALSLDIDFDTSDGTFSIDVENEKEKEKIVMLLDGRGIIDHNLYINGGILQSSDYSQFSGGMLRGKKGSSDASDYADAYPEIMAQNYDFFRNASYPGIHALLDVADMMSTYAWARYGIPGRKYSQTFNLHLNPAVTYLAEYPSSDFVTDATFDDNGRLLTVSKPYAYAEEVINLCHDGKFGSLPDGRYRYKVTEKSETKTLGDGYYLLENDQEFLMDITKNVTGDGDDNYKVVFLKDKSSDSSKNSEFINTVTKTYINKTVEGSDKITIKSLDEIFEYEISTEVPKGAAGFEVTDNLEKVLEFAGSESVTVSINGSPLPSTEQKKCLSVSGKKLVVNLDEKLVEKYGGKKMSIAFKARLVEGVDKEMLSEYENYTVPNVVEYSVSNLASDLIAAADVEIPEEVLDAYEEASEETTEEAPEEITKEVVTEKTPVENNETVDKRNDNKKSKIKSVKTGDSDYHTVYVFAALIILSAATLTGIARRRKRGR